MEAKLYVGNLPYETTESELRTLFSEAGTVSDIALITDRETGRMKGFGFITMSSQDEAAKAIQLFNGKDMGGRPLTVNAARPREERPSRPFGGSRRGGGSNYRY
ncbi:MAG TPA: RNA-binding protein [Chloroflexi bacterium]|nr:RNA-binding protein [Chloroflexota bacterium]HPO59151.1 RNA-binding protein [Anaerolineaceae bacterium]